MRARTSLHPSIWVQRFAAARWLYSSRPATTFGLRWMNTQTVAATDAAHTGAAGAPSSIATALAQQLSSPVVLSHLHQYGFCVIDHVTSGAAQVMGSSAASATTSSTSHSSSSLPSSLMCSPACASPLSSRLHSEVLSLSSTAEGRTDLMRPNHTHLIAGAKADPNARRFVAKQAIREADFAARPELLEETGADAPLSLESRAFWSELVTSPLPIDALNASLGPHCTIDRMTVKAQINEGNSGCFPLHFDTDARVDSRKLTAIFYANPSWLTAAPSSSTAAASSSTSVASSASSGAEGDAAAANSSDGGELRLYPFPHGALDIAPIDDRLVLFDSSRMLHRVLPSTRQRICVSVWFWQQQAQWEAQKLSRGKGDESSFAAEQTAALKRLFPDSSASDADATAAAHRRRAALSHLLSDGIRPHFVKLYLQHEWFASIEEAHGDSDDRTQMLVRHLDETEQVERALAPLLRQISADKDAEEHLDYAWQRTLPLPWAVPPTLPPFARFVAAPAVATEAPTLPGSLARQHDASHAPPRLIDWLA